MTSSEQAFSTFFLLAIILIEGFVTISAEILTIRQLIPVVGSSVIVTSLIIGIFLLFLAYGYRKGGTYAGHYIAILKRNFTIAAVLLGIGLSYVFIDIFFNFFIQHISRNILIPLVTYLLVITSPLVYFLGQTIPITMNLLPTKERAGAIGGKVLHLSTLGSFLGAVLTSLLFMNFFGVAWTVVLNFFLLLCLIIILLTSLSQEIILLSLLAAVGLLVFGLNVISEKILFVLTNNYANYEIRHNFANKEGVSGKLLIINNSPSSFLGKKNQAFDYVELIKKILFTELNLRHKTILVIGAGGFTLSAQGSHHNRITYIDIDKKIKSVVEQGFIKKIKGQFVATDGRNFIHYSQQKYNVIISDVYSHRYNIPPYLLTREYFRDIKKRLTQPGYAIFNIIARPTLSNAYSKRIDNTIRSVFHSCMAIPTVYMDKPTNIIYVCQVNKQASDAMIYTDNKNQATMDSFKHFLR